MATQQKIHMYEVIEKHRVERPGTVVGVLKCPNPNCITTQDEPVESRFDVLDEGVRCTYCETIIREHIAAHIDVD